MTLDIVSPLVYTKVGVPITVSSVAQVRISRYGPFVERVRIVSHRFVTKRAWQSMSISPFRFPEALRLAASQFLDMTRQEVEAVAKQTLVCGRRACARSAAARSG